MTAVDLLNGIMQQNEGSMTERMLVELSEKIFKDFSELSEADKRSRAVVISRIEESEEHVRLIHGGREMERKVFDIFGVSE